MTEKSTRPSLLFICTHRKPKKPPWVDHGGARGTHVPSRQHILVHLDNQNRKTDED